MGGFLQVCADIYWPLLRLLILHLFVPFALVQSRLFEHVLFGSEWLLIRKDFDSKVAIDVLLDFNKKWYFRYFMRRMVQFRLAWGYHRFVKNGCRKLWNQFIDDNYVKGRELVNYYYSSNVN